MTPALVLLDVFWHAYLEMIVVVLPVSPLINTLIEIKLCLSSGNGKFTRSFLSESKKLWISECHSSWGRLG